MSRVCSMVTVIVLIVVLVALIVGTMMTLRSSARTGMPSQDVLERAKRRERELESSEKDDASEG
jgi:hypothetical protein